MYVTLSEFKNMYSICLPDNKVNKSLLYGHSYFKRMTAIRKEFILNGDTKDSYKIDMPFNTYLFDSDYDWKNSPADVNVFEINLQTFDDNDISSSITEIKEFSHGAVHKLIVKFDSNVPDMPSYNKLSFKLDLTPIDIKNKKYHWFIKEYITLNAFYNLLNTSDISKLQSGVASWNLNGVSVSVDSSTIRSVMEDIKKQINVLYNEYMPIFTGYFQGDVDNPSRYFGYNSVAGGNSYSATIDRYRGR